MVRGKKNFLPHAPLIMGFTVLFRLVSAACWCPAALSALVASSRFEGAADLQQLRPDCQASLGLADQIQGTAPLDQSCTGRCPQPCAHVTQSAVRVTGWVAAPRAEDPACPQDESCLAAHLGERPPHEDPQDQGEAPAQHGEAAPQANGHGAASAEATAGNGVPSALEAFLEGGADPVSLDRYGCPQEAGPTP